MGEIVAGLNNAQNWQIAYQEIKQATQVTPQGGYIPMSVFEVPILFSSRILIAKTVSNIPAGKRWKWAGNLRAYQSLPNAGVSGQKTEIIRFSLELNRSKLLIFPSYVSGYELTLGDAFWLRDLQLILYEFTGEVTDTTDGKLNTIASDVSDIKELIGG